MAQLGNSEDGTDTRESTVGEYYHYTLDRIYREKLAKADFSMSSCIEFDIYIDDYEVFLENENDLNDSRNSKLAFLLSSTNAQLAGQYSNHPGLYYSVEIELAQYIKHSGWNHVVVGKPDFVNKNQTIDWSGVTGYLIYYKGSSNFSPVKAAQPNLYVKIANIVNTGIVANIPKDSDKALKTDKSAVYISSAEGMADDCGTWNTNLSGFISNDYKTEGKGSVLQAVDYTQGIDDTAMYYLFDETADMSDIKTLNFDFFIDLPQFIKTAGNNIEVVLGNNRFANDDYYSWNMNLKSLKNGWNCVSFDIKDAAVNGSPDLKTAKVIMIRFIEINLDISLFPVITYGIDNLRYISVIGNNVLRIAGRNDAQDTNNDNNFEIGDDYYQAGK